MRTLIPAAVLLAISVSAVAQETIEVRVVNVDVVVRDRSGHSVKGLTRDDFEVLDNGKPQEITNLYEVRPPVTVPATAENAGAAAEPASPAAVEAGSNVELRPRKIVVFVDNYSLPPLRRNAVLASLQKYIDTRLRHDDQMMIVLYSGQADILSQFTSDKAVLEKVVESISGAAHAGFTNAMEVDQVKRHGNELLQLAKETCTSSFSRQGVNFADAYSQTIGSIDSHAEHATHIATQLLDTLGRTSSAMAGVDGKKVILLVGAHLPEKPGAELYEWAFNIFSPYDGQCGFRAVMNSQAFTGRSGAVHFSIETVAKQAAANNVALYVLDASDQRDFISAEKGGDSTFQADNTEKFETFTNTAMAYSTLARVTGGLAVTNTENFDLAFDTISRDLESYYSIGYRPPVGSSGQRNISVRAKNPQYRVRTRESYVSKSTDEQMNDRVIANLFDPVQGDWKVDVRAGTPQRDGNQVKAVVEVSLAPTVTLIPQGDRLQGGFTVYITVGNAGGGRSTVTKIAREVKIPASEQQHFLSKPMTFGASLAMSPGTNTISIGVLDQTSSAMGFARTVVTAE